VPSLFPSQIQTFPNMIEITASDGALIKQYQEAMIEGNLALAQNILEQIPNNQSKIITADYLNTINDTIIAVQKYFNNRYSPGYIVSTIQPINQQDGDFWFQVTGEV
jgi:predicted RND superfamily exporter protein